MSDMNWKVWIPFDPMPDTYYYDTEAEARRTYNRHRRDDSWSAVMYEWSNGEWVRRAGRTDEVTA